MSFGHLIYRYMRKNSICKTFTLCTHAKKINKMKQKLFMINIDKSGIELPIHANNATKTMAFNQYTQRLDYIIQCQKLAILCERSPLFSYFCLQRTEDGGKMWHSFAFRTKCYRNPENCQVLEQKSSGVFVSFAKCFLSCFLFIFSLFDTFFIIKFAVMCDFSDTPVWRNRRCDLAWKWQISWWIPLISFDNCQKIRLFLEWYHTHIRRLKIMTAANFLHLTFLEWMNLILNFSEIWGFAIWISSEFVANHHVCITLLNVPSENPRTWTCTEFVSSWIWTWLYYYSYWKWANPFRGIIRGHTFVLETITTKIII